MKLGSVRLLSASTLLFFNSQHTLAQARDLLPLSQQAWARTAAIMQAIKTHPFNQKLMDGSLPRDKFAYYIEQDVHYLQVYSQVNKIIAARIAPKYADIFLKNAHYTGNDEPTVVHEFLKYKLNLPQTGLIAPATERYNKHLLNIAKHEPVAVAVAAILPCQWIYSEIGSYIAKGAKPMNPYAPWFNTYASNASKDSTHEMIRIFDELAAGENEDIKQRMVAVFKESSQLELDFWDDSYNKAKVSVKVTTLPDLKI